jgi:hypothetical protein
VKGFFTQKRRIASIHEWVENGLLRESLEAPNIDYSVDVLTFVGPSTTPWSVQSAGF